MAQFPLYDKTHEFLGIVEVESEECGMLRRIQEGKEEWFIFDAHFGGQRHGSGAYIQNGGPIEMITQDNFTPRKC